MGATTDYDLLPEPMQVRFDQSFHVQLYTLDELCQVFSCAADNISLMYSDGILDWIPCRAHGAPRVALLLFRRCVDAVTNAHQADSRPG